MKTVDKFTKVNDKEKVSNIKRLYVGITKNDEIYSIEVRDKNYFSISGSTDRKITESDAEQISRDMLIDNFEDGQFDPDYLPSDAIDTDWFQDALEESNRFYAEGIYDEGSDDYPNRLAEEMVERGIVDEEEAKDDEFEAKEYIDDFVEDLSSDYDDPTEWFIDNFGKEEYNQTLVEKNLIDVEAVVDDMDVMEYFDNSTLPEEVQGDDGETYLFEASGGGQNIDELNNLAVSFLPFSLLAQVKRNWSKYHLKELPKKDFFPKVTQDEEAILKYYVNNNLDSYAKGGMVYIYNDDEYDEDEIVDVLKNDLLVYPDGIEDDEDLINYFLENEYLEVKRYTKGGELEKKYGNRAEVFTVREAYLTERKDIISENFNLLSEINKTEFDNKGVIEKYGNLDSIYVLYEPKPMSEKDDLPFAKGGEIKVGKKYSATFLNKFKKRVPTKFEVISKFKGRENKPMVEILTEDGRRANIFEEDLKPLMYAKGGEIEDDLKKFQKQAQQLEIDKEKGKIDDFTYMVESGKVNRIINYLIDKKNKMAKGGDVPKGFHKMPDGTIMKDSEHMAKGGYIPYEDVREFEVYVSSFYGKNGIYKDDYDGGFTEQEIIEAVSDYIKDPRTEWGGGDSIDRELMRDRYLIPSRYPNRKTEFKEKGGKMEKVKVISEVYSSNGNTYNIDEYRELSNEELIGQKQLSLSEAKNLLFKINEDAIDYEDEINELESVDELGDFVYENDLGTIENTYNYSWWGGTRQYIMVHNDGDRYDADYETMVFMSYHRGGDVRGNYEKYEAFEIDGYAYEEFPIFADRLTYTIQKDGKSITADTEDMEGYDLYIQQSDFDEFEENDTTNLDELGEKLGFKAYDYYEAGGTLPTPFGQAGLVGETGTLNEMELFAMGGTLPQGVHQYYANTYNPAYPTPHGYAKGGDVKELKQISKELAKSVKAHDRQSKELKKIASSLVEEGKMAKGGSIDDLHKRVEDLVRNLTSFEYEVFAFDNNIDPENANEMYDFIYNLNKKEAEKIIAQLKGVYAKGGSLLVGKKGYLKRDYGTFGQKGDKILISSFEYPKVYGKLFDRGLKNKYRKVDYEYDVNDISLKPIYPMFAKKGGMITSASEYHKVRNVEYDKRVKSGKIKDTDENFEKFDEMYFDELVKKGKINPKNYFGHGGMMHSQGFNDKLDESLGNTKGKRSKKKQNYKDRRDESEAMEKKQGRRKYARVKTMDKGNRKKRKTPMTLAKAIRRDGEKWQDALKRAVAMMKKDA